MTPKLVTFDCAETLVKVPANWTLGAFAVDCAQHVGLTLSPHDADVYQKMYMARLLEFVSVNRSHDDVQREKFWHRLASDWLESIGQPLDSVDPMRQAADELGFGPNSILFSLYDDVIPCLDLLDAIGIKAAVVSNWDYSLHRVLRMFGIYDRFVVVKASLEEGVEKPDPRLFEITLREAGYEAKDTFHVGDHVDDDLQGARNAGIRAALIDRSMGDPRPPYIRSLCDLPEAFAWID